MNTGVHVRSRLQHGFTILEMLIALAIAALLLGTLVSVIGTTFSVRDDTQKRTEATRELRFAMERMVRATRGSERLLVPLADNPGTNWRENVREQSVPAVAPEGDSALATAVLAVTLGPAVDVDRDGFADADNDKDGSVDEDVGADHTNDNAAGIIGIDDDADGEIDESNAEDDDEDEDQTGNKDEDTINGKDDDGDGAVDEDLMADMNNDGQAGITGVDDDGDGEVDESNKEDDDEDEDDTGNKDEDWFDPVVFFLRGSTLVERRPNLDPVDGTDFSEFPIADNVTHFRVERMPDAGRRAVLVDITLELAISGTETTRQSVRVRVDSST